MGTAGGGHLFHADGFGADPLAVEASFFPPRPWRNDDAGACCLLLVVCRIMASKWDDGSSPPLAVWCSRRAVTGGSGGTSWKRCHEVDVVVVNVACQNGSERSEGLLASSDQQRRTSSGTTRSGAGRATDTSSEGLAACLEGLGQQHAGRKAAHKDLRGFVANSRPHAERHNVALAEGGLHNHGNGILLGNLPRGAFSPHGQMMKHSMPEDITYTMVAAVLVNGLLGLDRGRGK